MAATPSPNYSDKFLLAGDPTFIGRVRQSMIAAAISIKNEAVTTSFHRERETLVVAIMNSPENYKTLFANSVATDANCISDATVAGATALTGANVAAQAALVTDAHIDVAVSSQFNSFIRTPGS